MGKKAKTMPFETPPDTADIKAFRGHEPERDPSRPYQFARQRRDILNLYNNPLGAYTTPELREQMTKSALEESSQAEGQSAIEENAMFNNQKADQLYKMADLTKPTRAQAAPQGGGLLNSLIGAGGGIAAALIT